MTCCSGECFESTFNERRATKQLKGYRKRGPEKTTRLLLDALRAAKIDAATVLDMAPASASFTTSCWPMALVRRSVDAAMPHIRLAREIRGRGHAERVTFVYGDLLALLHDRARRRRPRSTASIAAIPTWSGWSRRRPPGEATVRALSFRASVGGEAPWRRWETHVPDPGNPFRSYIHPTSATMCALRRQGLSACGRSGHACLAGCRLRSWLG